MAVYLTEEGYDLGPQAPGAVDCRLEEMLHHPSTAQDWLDYVGRFDAPFRPDEEDMRMFDMCWMVLAESVCLCWLDLWIFFCLARRIPRARGVEGPDLGYDFSYDWDDRCVRFRSPVGHQ